MDTIEDPIGRVEWELDQNEKKRRDVLERIGKYRISCQKVNSQYNQLPNPESLRNMAKNALANGDKERARIYLGRMYRAKKMRQDLEMEITILNDNLKELEIIRDKFEAHLDDLKIMANILKAKDEIGLAREKIAADLAGWDVNSEELNKAMEKLESKGQIENMRADIALEDYARKTDYEESELNNFIEQEMKNLEDQLA